MAVVGIRDRETGQVAAMPVTRTDKVTLQGFVEDRTEPYALVYTDEAQTPEVFTVFYPRPDTA